MKKVVQLCSFHSSYNDDLQKRLTENSEFNSEFELVKIYIDDEMNKFLSGNPIKKSLTAKIISYFRFNKWLCRNYHFNNKQDIVNIQFVNTIHFFLCPFIKKNFNAVIVSFWGSDLLRQKKIVLKFLKRVFDIADVITVETEELKRIFLEMVSEEYESKIRIVKFGSSLLDVMDKCSESDISAFLSAWSIPSDKTIIVIGYNNCKAQQHLSAVKSILSAKLETDDIFVIIPWTYGSGDDLYRKELEDEMKGKINYCFIDKRLSDPEVGCLRFISNIFIQIQTTDSLSASMLETLYAGNNVITGNWLPYEELVQKGIKMEMINEPSETGKAVRKLIADGTSENVMRNNKMIARNILSWQENIKSWLSLYRS